MTASPSSKTAKHLYRIDKFKVPPPARTEFLEKARDSQCFLRTLPGFVNDAIFEQTDGPGAINYVTVVEWESAEAIEAAKKAVTARFEEIGFNPLEFRARLGIDADVAIYVEVGKVAT